MTPIAHLHIIGAGLAGLAAAVQAVRSGAAQNITIHEAANHAGGRCRSFFDPQLDRTIDTGSHLILGAYGATMDYLTTIGATGALVAHHPARFAMHHIATKRSWAIQPGDSPLWLLDPARRTPGTGVWAHLRDVWRLRGARASDTVGDRLAGGCPTLRAHLWDPFVVAVMNTNARDTSAALLWRVVSETLLAGEAACRAYTAPRGLSAALVDPALVYLQSHGVELRFGTPLRDLKTANGRVSALIFDGQTATLGSDDAVILAVPPKAARRLLPDLAAPNRHHCILNVHFRLNGPVELPDGAPFIGLIGGRAQWLFARADVLSVTVSAADDLADTPAKDVARALWREAAPVIGADPDTLPPHRVIREKAATMAHTPKQMARRPGPATNFANLRVAGDWTDTGLPATIEGAVRSGLTALKT